MSPGYELGLAMKIPHLNIKDHVAAYKLIIWRWGHTIRQDLESNKHIFHLLLNGITPKGGASGFIDGIRLFNWGFQSHTYECVCGIERFDT